MRLKYKVGLVVAGISVATTFTLPVRAEELVLKNGQKIAGKIVGYENDMFRVETEFGFALVRKDSIATVNFAPRATPDATKKSEDRKGTGATSASAKARPTDTPSEGSDVTPSRGREPRSGGTAPAPVSRPLDEPLPPQLQEHIDGNNYVNDTFHFAMYKPPSWKVFEGVPRETRSAIVALGTQDEQTVLFVDRQVWIGAPDLNSDRIESRLRQTYRDYQKLSESPIEVDRRPAILRVFKGVIDDTEWHGMSVHLAEGNTVFGIIGLTSSEMFQFQQALFNKIIHSFHFLSNIMPAGGSPRPGSSR